MAMKLTLQPAPAARKLLAQELDRALAENRSPDWSTEKEGHPELGQEIMDGARRLGFYGGYGPGHGLSLIVYLREAQKNEVIKFVTEHPEGGEPRNFGMVPPPRPTGFKSLNAVPPAVKKVK
jgi:hypothetical protein